ncbi:MAG: vgr related protein [Sphingomonadaceae bacterium]|nr:vgr related protein [Sphingomonadaceae bacterium]
MARIEHSRLLTTGERALAARVFGDALDPSRVTVRRGKWFPFQPRRTVMAPDGHIWFHPDGTEWRDDFSAAGIASQALFVHELTHVWQHQSGINLPLRRRPFARYAYLPLTPGKSFASHGIEQQAAIVADAFLIASGIAVRGAPALDAYAGLIPFATSVSRGRDGGVGNARSPTTS